MSHQIEFESHLDAFTKLAALLPICPPAEVLEWIEQIWRVGKLDGHVEAASEALAKREAEAISAASLIAAATDVKAHAADIQRAVSDLKSEVSRHD